METSKKKVGIIISILAVIILALVVCFCVVNVNDSRNTYVQSNNDIMTTADADFVLQGDYTQMQDIWNSAIEESIKYNKNIKVVLGKDWVAQADTNYTTSFGEGVGFKEGRIWVPNNANITLELKGKTIDRQLSVNKGYGSTILVSGILNITDCNYNVEAIQEAYENYKDNKEQLINILDSVINSFGKITGGASGDGGGIYVNGGILNFYGTTICNNNATTRGGGIFGSEESEINVYGGLFINNYCLQDAGAFESYGDVTINNGIFINNSSRYGGAIYSTSKNYDVLGAIFAYNVASESGGAAYSYGGVLNFDNCSFYKNTATRDGGAISGANKSENIVTNCDISENTASYGGAISANDGSVGNIKLNGGSMYRNTADIQGGALYAHGGLSGYNYQFIGNVQIYDNMVNGVQSDVYLVANKKIEINGALATSSATAYIGITLAPNYGDVPFTMGYKYKGNSISPSKIFFSNNTNNGIVLKEDEAILSTTTTKPIEKCEWILTPENGTPIKTTGTNITVPYNGKKYTLTNSKAQFTRVNNSTKLTSFDGIKDVGSFGFDTDANVLNPVVTITVVPKEVDIEWTNTSMTYNGASQIPIATIKASDLVAGDECTITVSGAQTLAGNYIATLSTLSNSNYKLKQSARQYTEFTISKANLTIDITTKNVSKEYNGKVVDIGNDWYNITTNGLLGVDSGKAIDKLFNIDYSAFITQFNGNDTAIAVGEYTISTKPFTASEVFRDNLNYNVTINYVNTGKLTITNPSVIRPTDNSGYDFIILQNNKRVSYKEKELIHGDNDSEYTNFVLGNIAPNTSVQTLLNNISFDTTLITIYNGANEIVYGENAKAFYTKNIDNGTELAVGTGWYIRYEKLTGGEETIYLAVLGDLIGDGKVNSADVNRLRQMVNNSEVYTNSSEVVKLSSLIINNGKTPTNADAEILWNVVCGKIDITDFI